MTNPWMKFYASDWRSDPRLKMCSAGARGVWIEMICLMHEATPYGHLLIHGQPPNVAQLASLTGIPLAELGQYLSELEQMGVFSRTKESVIYSRKLVRMASRSAKMRKNGKKGGNPKLSESNDNPDLLNQRLNVKDKPQKPEARSQIEDDTDVSSSVRSPSFDEFWQAWPLRKVAKESARQAFSKLSKQNRADAIESASEWADHWRRCNPTANDIHPATYLNKKRWTDEWPSQPPLTLINGGPHDQSPRNNRETAKSDALRDTLDAAAGYRRTSEANWL